MSENPPNFFALSAEQSSPENARAAIVPCPYEAASPCGQGLADGPAELLKASLHIELFDEELWVEPCQVGIQTVEPVMIPAFSHEETEPFKALTDLLAPLVEFNKFPVLVGGEHSISLGAVNACTGRYPDLSVLQISAHANLKEGPENDKFNQSSVAYHIYKALPEPKLTSVAVRNISKAEADWMEAEQPQINLFWARNQEKWNISEIISTLSDNVYLSIDLNALDCGVMPAVSRPEPGGMSWYQLLHLIKQLCIKKNVVAADLVGYAPIAGMHAASFLVAKLLYKIIGYRFALELGVTKKYL